ncbi:hypothetical protein C9439_00605 [archaeon SCG-AAA382B04]|nr:hypothetical protein C9439_00605 [archaeon SCG-AAA382B04]
MSNKKTQQPQIDELFQIKKIVLDAFPILLLSLFGSILAGIVLGGMENTLEILPGLIVVIPAMLDMRGNIYGALGSRISTGLHQGLLDPAQLNDQHLRNAITASLINSTLVSFLLAIIAWLILKTLNQQAIPIHQLALITLIAGILSGIILTIIVTTAVYQSYKRGLNPDDIVGPVVTVTGDIFSITILFLVAKLITGGI